MWIRTLLLGVRGVLAVVAGVVAVTASISSLGVYAREGSLDSTVLVAIGAWIFTAWTWPDEEHRAKLLERHSSEQRKPPFWIFPTLGGVIASLLALLTVIAGIYWSQEQTITQLEEDLALARGEHLVEQRIAYELAGLLCQGSTTPVECHPQLLEEARRIVVNQMTDG